MTPLNVEGKLNEAVYRDLIDYLADNGIHGVFPFGTTGEFYAYDQGFYDHLLEVTKDAVHGRMQIYAGANHITTKGAIAIAKAVEKVGGIDAVLDAVDFDSKLEGVSLVVTGEGRIDGQSVRFGKVPVGVAKRSAAKGIPTVAIVGGMGEGAEGLFDLCESTIQTTVSGLMSLEKAMADAPALYEYAAERLFRAIRIGMKLK